MKNFQNKVAVITGAGSGIGRALARELAADGARLAISDIDPVGLEETVNILGLDSDRLISEVFDVADRDAFYAFAERVTNHFGAAHLVFNNAGVALGATVEAMDYQDFEWLMGINFWGVVYGTKAFLPHLRAAGEGHIVNLSSIFGLIGVPTQSAYNAAKFAVRGFTEALRQELEMEGGQVFCSCVHPGGIKTNIARNARLGSSVEKITGNDPHQARRDFEKLFRTSPEEAARTILKGVRNNKRRIMVGTDAHTVDGMQRLMPTAYQKIMVAGQKLMRKQT